VSNAALEVLLELVGKVVGLFLDVGEAAGSDGGVGVDL
jgi:hypothetical protein